MNYSTHEAAAQAVQHLHGIEFPPHSSHRLKVMFAEPLGAKPSHTSRSSVTSASFDPASYDSQAIDGANPLEDRLVEDGDSVTGTNFSLNGNPDESKVYALMS